MKHEYARLHTNEKEAKQILQDTMQRLEVSSKTDSDVAEFFRNTKEGLNGIHTLEDFQSVAKSVHVDIANRKQISQQLSDQLMKLTEKVCKRFVTEVHRIESELKRIEKFTALKIGNKTVSIYEFVFHARPTDISTEELIQRHLESIDASDEKALEKALSPMQLMTAAWGNNPNFMSVYCRKPVDTEELLESKALKWEITSHFSGGEKWFRNASLFFAILNFVAEKNNVNLKRNPHCYTRFVIMDNPFANASTLNVTRPVFILADQMRFQMICLTAINDPSILPQFSNIYSVDPMTTDDPNISSMSVHSYRMRFASSHANQHSVIDAMK